MCFDLSGVSMKTPKLKWNEDAGEGYVSFPDEFNSLHWLTKADAIEDWIIGLQDKYKYVIEAKNDGNKKN